MRYELPAGADPIAAFTLLNHDRYQWDSKFSNRTILFKEAEDVTIYRYNFKLPVGVFSLRDFAEKEIHFMHDGLPYSYVSCIPDAVCPCPKDNVRTETIFAIATLRKEGEKYVSYSVYQYDFKVANLAITGG